ncbi:hypothetical protein B7R21_07055 [Subtercola boreus]|uniref:Ig-like domain-containing protein n=1 Tax=Subtercola boreus TaxID=120213 RepID=A0A3E0VX89_9MICO|nr:hypothetical protein [Subtercola boreus]RFA14330.1 hypothetical protein B7R21_07055 [Subtercola boreus]
MRLLVSTSVALAVVVIMLGGGGGAAQAGPPAPSVTGAAVATFVVPTAAQNGGAAYVPVQGVIEGAGSSYRLPDYVVSIVCGGTNLYPPGLTTFGTGTITFSALVPISETGNTCVVAATSAIPWQQVAFEPSQTWVASEFLPTARVDILGRIVTRSATGGL